MHLLFIQIESKCDWGLNVVAVLQHICIKNQIVVMRN